MYKVTVNQDFVSEINPKDLDWDLLEIHDRHFHILLNNKSYTAIVVEADYSTKSFQIRINNNLYTVAAKDRFDLLAEKLGFGNIGAQKVNEIKAPMPGLVLSILVEEGQEVKKGESLLILEAMKMENVLKAPADVVIKKIRAQKGAAVEKNQILIDLA